MSYDHHLVLSHHISNTMSHYDKTWVMRQSKSSNEVVLWNALTGTSYLQTDETCPLQKIYYLASIDNIYSNIERGKKPSSLNFDLSNRRKWTPLHRAKKLLDTTTRMTVQDESLQFSLPDHQYARELHSEISESLQNAIRSARRVATSFRSDVSTMIGHTIEKLEDMKILLFQETLVTPKMNLLTKNLTRRV